MSLTEISTELQPTNDPSLEGPQNEGSVRDVLSDSIETVRPSELRGLSLSEAEDAYVGVRRAEDGSGQLASGTKHERARQRYAELLDLDRLARATFDQPAVGMQTLVFDPSTHGSRLGPIEQATVVTDGTTRAVARTRRRLGEGNFVYFGVRDIDSSGLSHWHVCWEIDISTVDADSLDLYAGVESHVRHTNGATLDDHPATEAVKWDPSPERTVEPVSIDELNGGPVHPLARYVAGSLPHLAEVGEMTPQQVRHGTVEWGSPGQALKRSNRNALPSDIGGLVGLEARS
jgi:hypothetical protein